jgi:hypothetical protein
MDDALHRTIEAVTRYEVPDRVIAIAAASLEGMPGNARRDSELFALVDSVQLVAGSHGGVHPDCTTCTAIKNSLAVSMAAVRAEADIALSEMIAD